MANGLSKRNKVEEDEEDVHGLDKKLCVHTRYLLEINDDLEVDPELIKGDRERELRGKKSAAEEEKSLGQLKHFGVANGEF